MYIHTGTRTRTHARTQIIYNLEKYIYYNKIHTRKNIQEVGGNYEGDG